MGPSTKWWGFELLECSVVGRLARGSSEAGPDVGRFIFSSGKGADELNVSAPCGHKCMNKQSEYEMELTNSRIFYEGPLCAYFRTRLEEVRYSLHCDRLVARPEAFSCWVVAKLIFPGWVQAFLQALHLLDHEVASHDNCSQSSLRIKQIPFTMSLTC